MPGPLRLPPLTPAEDGSDTFEVLGWKVFAPGYWKKEFFSPARVARIVENYRTLKALNPDYAPRAKLGHDKEQRLARSLGLPNAGRVTDLRPTPDGGFEIDVRGIPRTALVSDADGNPTAFDIHKAFAGGQYDSGSVEITPGVRHPERPTEELGDVFDGIAFLGEENPAVKATARPQVANRTRDFSAGSARLCFSEHDYSEHDPMRDQCIQTICQKLGLTPDDPLLAGKSDDELKAWADKVSSQQFSDHMKKTYSDPPNPQGAGGGPAGGDMTAFMAECKKMFADQFGDLNKRIEAAEAAVTDSKKQADDAAVQSLMSEGARVVEHCVATGRLSPRLKEQKLGELKALARDPKVFSDGADKGLTAFQAELKALQARQPDLMFSEGVDDSGAAGATGPSDFARRAMRNSPKGQRVLRDLAKQKQ